MIPRQTLDDLGFGRLLEFWSSRCHTDRGATRVLAECFERSRQQAIVHMQQIGAARLLNDQTSSLPFGGITDITVALARADKGAALDPEALIAIARTAHGALRLRQYIEKHSELCEPLIPVAREIEDLGHMFFPIEESFEPSGRIADHASDELAGLRRQVSRLRGQLEESAKTLVDDPRYADFLQDSYYTIRDDRYVLPIKVEYRSAVKGIVHGTSGSGQTVFVEPDAIVELNNKLKLADCAVADEEQRILAKLSEYVAEETEGLRAAVEAATTLDIIDGAARLADDLRATSPTISDSGVLELVNGRHPLMELGGTRKCIPNDITLTEGKILVISGPNAGGKTVALKMAGLAALMVRAGLHVAASDGSKVPWYESVFTDIGDSQSIENNLSTFSAHLLSLGRFLKGANHNTLLLIDELAVGTAPEQGAALAQAILEALADRGVPTIVTTHYERLKALAGQDDRFANASVGFDFEKMQPTFRLHLGAPGSSGALDVARRMELSEDVVVRAEELLGDQRATVEGLLASLSQAREQLDEDRAEAIVALDTAQAARTSAEAAEAKAKAKLQAVREDAHDEAIDALRSARAALDRARKTVKKRSELAEHVRAVDAAARAIADNAPAGPTPSGRVPHEHELVPGVRVIIPKLGGTGEVVATTGRGKVTVKLGSMKTTVDFGDVLLVSDSVSTPPKQRQGGVTVDQAPDRSGPTPSRTSEATLDLRGERVAAAVDAVDRFIDRSLLDSRDVVFVIHGHGTGALRAAVREQVAAHPAVTNWRPGEKNEGGDGVTVAFLDV